MISAYLLSWLMVTPATPPPVDARDVVVVCDGSFLRHLHPWLVHRTNQGHRVAYVSSNQPIDSIARQIREVAREGKLRFVVLIGDVGDGRVDDVTRQRRVPTHFVPLRAAARWSHDEHIASDNQFGDLDNDGIPELAVGRIPADTPEELARIVRKIIQYEQSSAGGLWRRRINLVAGLGGFGRLKDSVIEMTTKKFLTEGIPAAFRTSMTYGSWRSPYCPDPRDFRLTTLFRFNEGCLCWVYMGHGQCRHLDRIRIAGMILPVMESSDVKYLRSANGSPIAVLLSCYSGAYDKPDDCLAEEMVKHGGGPVACIAASRVTLPYGMAVLGEAMMRQFFGARPTTLGEVLLNSKREAMRDESDRGNRWLLDALAKAFNPTDAPLSVERADHVYLFNLLGDPLTRIEHPQTVRLTAPNRIQAGRQLRVQGLCDLNGTCLAELVCRRDRLTFRAPSRRDPQYGHDELEGMNETYMRANDQTWSSTTVACRDGQFRFHLDVPEDARGPCHVRVFVQGEKGYAVGSSDVYVWKEKTTPNPKKHLK